MVFDDTVDMAEQARFAMEFCAEESCGKCTPCRVGATRGVEVIDRIRHADNADEHANEPGAHPRSVPGDDRWFALRDGWPDSRCQC